MLGRVRHGGMQAPPPRPSLEKTLPQHSYTDYVLVISQLSSLTRLCDIHTCIYKIYLIIFTSLLSNNWPNGPMARRLTTIRSISRDSRFDPWLGHISSSFITFFRIGGLVVKLAVAILHRTVSASPGFDSRPMQRVF